MQEAIQKNSSSNLNLIQDWEIIQIVSQQFQFYPKLLELSKFKIFIQIPLGSFKFIVIISFYG